MRFGGSLTDCMPQSNSFAGHTAGLVFRAFSARRLGLPVPRPRKLSLGYHRSRLRRFFPAEAVYQEGFGVKFVQEFWPPQKPTQTPQKTAPINRSAGVVLLKAYLPREFPQRAFS